jgi:hypothetical protein
MTTHIADRYSKIASKDLKTTTQKRLTKFWQDELKRRSIPYQYNTDGKLVTAEQLGEHFISEVLVWDGCLNEKTEYVTLGELAASREDEQDVVQFEVNPANVEKLIANTNDGILNQPLYRLIEIVYLPNSDRFAIGGGRHRLI